ncbi:MAG: hypothetical protein UT66_C0036G0016 [candidate division CPR2 bacterium GW2011_GWC1_39_9]|uniref:PRC-barrel domain-containing protein n=1 Tax=candidate division CPR2 bacterium GW2011_GWC2_39_10 TaxID=1618345 RepID=A0A0G0M4F6_UNCC2|nr:MAG: hypothetical protein UT18_C0003G0049 [candidate division CPR2 bacterium GW2011_GWC2_39_10]KKR33607.1 MAG: hypothetical protein UT66_C0036G0016 [candidate division CPR2 bacterium GW2011_GWC1_39_9]
MIYNIDMRMFSTVYNMPVNSLNEGMTVGVVEDIIINPDTGQVLGFKLSETSIRERYILVASDIREINDLMLIIDDSQNLSTLDEVIKIAEVVGKKIKWMGIKVETDLGRKLGKIEDLAFDTTNFYLTRIYTSGGLIKEALSLEKTIIPANKIIKVTKKVVIVEDSYVKNKKSSEAIAPEAA